MSGSRALAKRTDSSNSRFYPKALRATTQSIQKPQSSTFPGFIRFQPPKPQKTKHTRALPMTTRTLADLFRTTATPNFHPCLSTETGPETLLESTRTSSSLGTQPYPVTTSIFTEPAASAEIFMQTTVSMQRISMYTEHPTISVQKMTKQKKA